MIETDWGFIFAAFFFSLAFWMLFCNTRCFLLQDEWLDRIHKNNMHKIWMRYPDDQLLDYDTAKPSYEKCWWLLFTFRDPHRFLAEEIRDESFRT